MMALHCACNDRPIANVTMRRSLLCIVQACEAQHFALGTLALAVSMLDRFLLRTAVRQEDAWAVQLTAVACLSIAAKFEEVNLPYSVAYFQVMAAVRQGRKQPYACILPHTDIKSLEHQHWVVFGLASVNLCAYDRRAGGGTMAAAVFSSTRDGHGAGCPTRPRLARASRCSGAGFPGPLAARRERRP